MMTQATVRRAQKITLGTMRAFGMRNLIVFCADYRCSHVTQISAERWGDDVRLSDLESLWASAHIASNDSL